MPEEKKESFTFSDKIKNSKPAGSKSFAKSSSKIGRDGKPKQTIFERTRRDAPFFIAALVALLLLPFLYKYSGQSGEDTLLTPGSEESMFDPERYGFDTATITDPDGQVAQLSGRSSFDLIRGFGNNEEDYKDRDDFDFDSSSSASGEYDAEGRYDASKNSSTRIDEEENITNIYKRRARAGTRAAFRRTPIKDLGRGAMARPGGHKLGVKEWGGGLKNAANKVGSSGPRNSPKPVSLQPLRSGGSARSNFGQGSAAAARKGLDNMGKANAAAALRDAYVKPVDPSKTGGLDFTTGGTFGGNGKLDRNINIAPGREPWWWDMMKTRMQKEWEARFNYKWGWINWATDIAKNILKGLLNCLITGDSDGDPDNFLGDVSINGSSGGAPTCCGKKESWFPAKEVEDAGGFEKFCNGSTKKKYGAAPYNLDCGRGYKGGGSAGGGASVGFFGQRLKCLGINVGGYASGELGLNGVGGKGICDDMPYQYVVIPSGQARKWHIYTFVTARNYFPESLKNEFQGKVENFPRGGNLLCVQSDMAHGGSGLNHTGGTSAGVGYGSVAAGKKNAAGTNVTQQTSTGRLERSSEYEEIRRNTLEVNPNEKYHSCVIYVQNSGTFNYEVFKNEIIDQFKTLLGGNPNKEELAQKAFSELDLLTIESVAMKDNLAAGRGSSVHKIYDKMLPMLYWEFENAYILHKGVTNRQNGHDNDISKKKYRVEYQDMIRGEECYFADWMFDCMDQDQPAAILKTRKGQLVGDQWVEAQAKPNEFTVVAELVDLNGQVPPIRRPVAAAPVEGKSSSFMYVMNLDGVTLPKEGNIVWTATHHNGATKRTIKHTCPYGITNVPPQEDFPPAGVCQPGQIEDKMGYDPRLPQCPYMRTCTEDGTWGQWMMKDPNLDACQSKDGYIVGFYNYITDFPCEENLFVGQYRRDGQAETKAPCDNWKNCDLTVYDAPLINPDAETLEYVAQAKQEFDAANQAQGISLNYEVNSLTVANLVDAIRIHKGDTVPANVACVLGKSIGAASADPQAGDKGFDNIFGAFLAFIGIDSASFPSQYTYNCDGNSVYNSRFPCKSGYWWGGYVDSNQSGKAGLGVRKEFKDAKFGNVWGSFPLKGLLRDESKNQNTSGVFPTTDGMTLQRPSDLKKGQSLEEYYRAEFAKRYYDLVRNEQCKYKKGETLAKQDVLAYVDILCKHGEEVKPQAWLECTQKLQQKKHRPNVGKKRSGTHRKINKKRRASSNRSRTQQRRGAYNKKCAGC